jgi:hypothetical protein
MMTRRVEKLLFRATDWPSKPETASGFRRRRWITGRVFAECRYQFRAWWHVMKTGHNVFDDAGSWECNTCRKQL